MRYPAPILVTPDNYIMGKVSSFGQNYILFGIYSINNGPHVRVKVPLGGGPAVGLTRDEWGQFPEHHEFEIPDSAPARHNGGNHIQGRD